MNGKQSSKHALDMEKAFFQVDNESEHQNMQAIQFNIEPNLVTVGRKV